MTYMAIWPLALRMLVPPAPPLAILLSEIMIKLWLMPPFLSLVQFKEMRSKIEPVLDILRMLQG